MSAGTLPEGCTDKYEAAWCSFFARSRTMRSQGTPSSSRAHSTFCPEHCVHIFSLIANVRQSLDHFETGHTELVHLFRNRDRKPGAPAIYVRLARLFPTLFFGVPTRDRGGE